MCIVFRSNGGTAPNNVRYFCLALLKPIDFNASRFPPQNRASICLILFSIALRTNVFDGTSNRDDAMV
jgi:hypothetical protein